MGLTRDQIKDLPALAVPANPDLLNGILLATDRLIDATNQGGTGNAQGYFQAVVAAQAISVGAMVFKLIRTGSTAWAGVGLYKPDGTLLAYGNAQGTLGGQSGWRRVAFSAPFTLQAGSSYVLGIGAGGDDIPGWAAADGRGDINVFITQPPYRSFRRSVGTMNQNMDFSLANVSPNSDTRLFLGLVSSYFCPTNWLFSPSCLYRQFPLTPPT